MNTPVTYLALLATEKAQELVDQYDPHETLWPQGPAFTALEQDLEQLIDAAICDWWLEKKKEATNARSA